MEDTPKNEDSAKEQQEAGYDQGKVPADGGDIDKQPAPDAEDASSQPEGSPIRVRVVSDSHEALLANEDAVNTEASEEPVAAGSESSPAFDVDTSGHEPVESPTAFAEEPYEPIERTTPTVRHAAVARTQSTARAYTSNRKPLVSRARQSQDGPAEAPHRPSVRGERVVRPEMDQQPPVDVSAPDAAQPSEEGPRPKPQPRQRPHVEQEPAHRGKLTPKLIVELAAPHTWAASTMPVLLAISLCIADTSAISISTALILLVICVLMQSAVNTINDYFDYVKGADTVDNQDDPTDAVLVYNDIDPKQARNLALVFLGAAFLLGIFMIVRAGWIPLVIALIGAVIVFLYSGGRTPISYLPIGEVVSGFTMGGLIPLACYQVLTLDFSWMVLVYSIPLMIGIALIMMTNNTCDIEKDIVAERKTLPTLLGRDTSVTVYRSLLVIWLVAIALLVIVGYPRGWYGLFFLIAGYGPLKALFTNPFTAQTRGGGMAAITSTNAILGMGYAICLLMSVAAFPVL